MSIGVSHHDPGFLRRNVGIGLGPEANMWSQCNCSQNVSMVQRVVSFQMGKRCELFGLLLTALLIRGSVLFTSGAPRRRRAARYSCYCERRSYPKNWWLHGLQRLLCCRFTSRRWQSVLWQCNTSNFDIYNMGDAWMGRYSPKTSLRPHNPRILWCHRTWCM
jgi:hypothetical protein